MGSAAAFSGRGDIDVRRFACAGELRKIYCECGRIIGLDSGQVRLKLSLGKKLECAVCRNARISREMDELDRRYSGEGDEGEGLRAGLPRAGARRF